MMTGRLRIYTSTDRAAEHARAPEPHDAVFFERLVSGPVKLDVRPLAGVHLSTR
jgi:hypothetical protein